MLISLLQTIHNHRISRRFAPILLLMIALSLVVLPAAAQDSSALQQDDNAAQEIIRTINAWRIEQGLWPLRENTTLDRMAFDQATYVLSLPTTPEESAIHLGRFGEAPPARAELPQYQWPAYGAAQNTAVGEIAYTGYNAVAAQNFWENSPIHKRTALNPAYREIGVAAVPQHWGHFYLVDFGARPNVLPAMVDMSTHMLYLSNERYAWARSPWIRNVLKVRLFDSDGKPLDSDWEAWEPQLPLPANAGDSLYVEYLDESGIMVLAPVSLEGTANAALPTQTPTATPTSTTTATESIATATPSATALNTAIPTSMLTSAPVVGAAATSTPTSSPTAAASSGAAPTALLIYDAKSLTLLNATRAPINVSGLVFVGKNTTFVATRWSTQWLSGTLTALAGSDCLQVWSWLEKNPLEKPGRCRQRRAVLTIAPEQLFWKQGDFRVQWGQSTLATCYTTDTQCAFALPS
jgi:uncharacterized protein YkwD